MLTQSFRHVQLCRYWVAQENCSNKSITVQLSARYCSTSPYLCYMKLPTQLRQCSAASRATPRLVALRRVNVHGSMAQRVVRWDAATTYSCAAAAGPARFVTTTTTTPVSGGGVSAVFGWRAALTAQRRNETSAPTTAGMGSGSSATQLSYSSYVIRKFVGAAMDIPGCWVDCSLPGVVHCASICNIPASRLTDWLLLL